MLLEWTIVGLIIAVTLYFATRSMFRTAKGERACCSEGEKEGCRVADMIHSHNLPSPKSCNGKPLHTPEAVEDYRRRMERRRREKLASEHSGTDIAP